MSSVKCPKCGFEYEMNRFISKCPLCKNVNKELENKIQEEENKVTFMDKVNYFFRYIADFFIQFRFFILVIIILVTVITVALLKIRSLRYVSSYVNNSGATINSITKNALLNSTKDDIYVEVLDTYEEERAEEQESENLKKNTNSVSKTDTSVNNNPYKNYSGGILSQKNGKYNYLKISSTHSSGTYFVTGQKVTFTLKGENSKVKLCSGEVSVYKNGYYLTKIYLNPTSNNVATGSYTFNSTGSYTFTVSGSDELGGRINKSYSYNVSLATWQDIYR